MKRSTTWEVIKTEQLKQWCNMWVRGNIANTKLQRKYHREMEIELSKRK